MLISNGVSYLPVIFPTNEEIDTYPKVLLTPAWYWKPSDIYDDDQWEDSDDDAISSANVFATRYTQSNDVLEPIISD